MKVCPKCQRQLLTTDFEKNRSKKSGVQGYCRECSREYRSARRLKDLEAARARDRKYRTGASRAKYLATKRASYQKHKTKWKEYGRRYSRSRRRHSFERKLIREYRIDLHDYALMWVAQGCACATCHVHFDETVRVCVDHCHSTGQVRGLLCDPCNKALGQVKDNPQRLRNLATYLEGCRA